MLEERCTAFEGDLPGLRQASSNVFKLSAQFQQVEAATLLQSQVNGLQDRAGERLHELATAALGAAQVQPSRIVEQAARANQLVLGLGLGILVLSPLTVVFLVRRSIVRPVKRVADNLAQTFHLTVAGVGEIAKASQSLAEGASEQAASLEETSASLEEMSGMTRNNAENAAKVNELARQARQAADNGAREMESMSQAMQDIKRSSDDIAKIIKTIDEIAFQTNILALNAAVEAARAGEAGMGFAVVAEEVRSLAQRSAHAAKETAGKIEGAISKTAQGVQISGKVAQNLLEIVDKIRRVDELAGAVATASKEQTQGIEQVNTAVTQVDQVTQSNAALAEQSAGAAEQLKAQTVALNQAVIELMALVDTRATDSARPGNSAVEGAPKPQPSGARVFRNGHPPSGSNGASSNGNGRASKLAEPESRPRFR